MSVESRLTIVEESLRLLRNANRLQGRPVSAAAPPANNLLCWNATTKKWEPRSPLHPVPIIAAEWTIGDITNSGAGGGQQRSLRLDSGTTASSTVSGHMNRNDIGMTTGVGHDVIDWTKHILVHVRFNPQEATTNGISLFTLGKSTGDGVGDLNNRGIGFKISNLALAGHVHDGTSATTTSTFTTLTEKIVVDLLIISNGSGTVEWFLDGISQDTGTGGPSAAGTAADSIFQGEVDNGGDAAKQFLVVHEIAIGSY